MALQHNFLPTAFFQGEYIPFESAKVSIAMHSLHYATAAFGGLRVIPDPLAPNTMLFFRLDRHTERLSQSAKLLNYDLGSEQIKEVLIEIVKRNKLSKSLYLRPLVYCSSLGISPRLHDIEKDFLVYGLELGDYLSPSGVACRISSWVRQEDRSLPLRGKITSAYVTSSLAKTEAYESGFDEAILMNTQGKVSEASAMNIFIVRRGELITPGPDQDILEGITRDAVITLAKEQGIKVTERAVDKSELFIAEEVFLTGTAARIAPVNRIEGYSLKSERPITNHLLTELVAANEGKSPKFEHWVTRCCIG